MKLTTRHNHISHKDVLFSLKHASKTSTGIYTAAVYSAMSGPKEATPTTRRSNTWRRGREHRKKGRVPILWEDCRWTTHSRGREEVPVRQPTNWNKRGEEGLVNDGRRRRRCEGGWEVNLVVSG